MLIVSTARPPDEDPLHEGSLSLPRHKYSDKELEPY